MIRLARGAALFVAWQERVKDFVVPASLKGTKVRAL